VSPALPSRDLARRLRRVLPALLSVGLVLAACAVGCGGAAPAASEQAARFDAERAWELLVEQVGIGARPAGSEGAERTRALIERELRAAGLEPVREAFEAQTPAGEIAMANVWAEIPAGGDAPDEAPVIVLGSHYDTKRVDFPFVGANDAGSSTAVLLELARVLASGPPRDVAYRVVFFDGEEALRSYWADPDNRYGSRHHVAELERSGGLERVRFMVLLDMVGDRDLKLTRDTYSGRELVDAFFSAAREAGLGRHVDGARIPVKDDHQSFLEAGVESVDLIDFDYGPANSWWHSPADTLDKCSVESLGVIGRIVLLGLPRVERMALEGR
jgi:hypothetical protein